MKYRLSSHRLPFSLSIGVVPPTPPPYVPPFPVFVPGRYISVGVQHRPRAYWRWQPADQELFDLFLLGVLSLDDLILMDAPEAVIEQALLLSPRRVMRPRR